MRLRPNLCTEWRPAGWPHGNPTRHAHHRPTTDGWLVNTPIRGGAGEGGAVEDVGFADFDLVEVEAAHRFEEDDGAGDDAGRAVGVEPSDAAASVDCEGGELGHDAFAGPSSESVAVDLF